MRITRSKSYRVKLQDYEHMDVMSSVTVDSEDLGVAEEDRVKMSDEEMSQHITEMSEFCADVLAQQLKPLLEEAAYLAEKKSAAVDVEKYNRGQRGA